MGAAPSPSPVHTDPTHLLQVREIYAEPAALELPRDRQVLARFPDAAHVIELPSHWQIADVHGNAGNVEGWVRVRPTPLVHVATKSLSGRGSTRSSCPEVPPWVGG